MPNFLKLFHRASEQLQNTRGRGLMLVIYDELSLANLVPTSSHAWSNNQIAP